MSLRMRPSRPVMRGGAPAADRSGWGSGRGLRTGRLGGASMNVRRTQMAAGVKESFQRVPNGRDRPRNRAGCAARGVGRQMVSRRRPATCVIMKSVFAGRCGVRASPRVRRSPRAPVSQKRSSLSQPTQGMLAPLSWRRHGNLPDYLGWRRTLEALGQQVTSGDWIPGARGIGPYQQETPQEPMRLP